jgi:hypothetical protein
MAGWLDAIMSPLNAAGDVAKGLVDIRDTVKFGEAVIKLQGQILAAQRGAITAQARETEMADEIRSLRERVVKMEAWEAERDRYRLEELPPGVFVLTLKPEKANGEPPHKICQTCYQRGKKSILHAGEPNSGTYDLKCHECGATLQVGHWKPDPLPPRRGGGSPWSA